jgi:hypothetical protein
MICSCHLLEIAQYAMRSRSCRYVKIHALLEMTDEYPTATKEHISLCFDPIEFRDNAMNSHSAQSPAIWIIFPRIFLVH